MIKVDTDDHDINVDEVAERRVEENSSLLAEWWLLSQNTKKFAAKAAIIASTGGLLFGYDIGVIEGALPQLEHEMQLSSGQQDVIVSTMAAGAIVGSLIAGFLVDHLGRWMTIVVTDITFILGSSVLFTAETLDVLLLGRFVVGAAVAISAVADVSYLAEVAPRSIRGAMVSANELAISLGVMGAFLAGHLLQHVDGGWRWMFGFSGMLALVQLCGMMTMPRSPKWLYSKGKIEEAEAVLFQILSNPDAVSAELVVMETSAASTKGSLRELLNCWRKPLIVSTSLAVSQQLTGNAVILNYTAEIFRMAGVVGSVHTVVLGGVKVLATVIAIIKVDQVGRKPFLLWGAVAFTCGLLLLSAGFALKSPIASFTACCVLVAAYSVSFGPLTWLVTAEMYPPAIRGKALGFGQVGSFVGNLVSTSCFLRLLRLAGGTCTFLFFAALCFLTVLFVAIVIPETKYREPQEVAAALPRCSCFCAYAELKDTTVGESSSREITVTTRVDP